MRYLALGFMIALTITATGCHHHRHHGAHAHPVRTAAKVAHVASHLDAEHHHKHVIVVNRPGHRKNCWKHGGHFHCHR